MNIEGMVLIPAGSFEMGGEDDLAKDDEQPVHTVHLEAFYMDVYEVTNVQFKVFVDSNPGVLRVLEEEFGTIGDSGHLFPWPVTNSLAGKTDVFAETSNHPVVNVSWYAAMIYAEWVGKRLPTEAEWEYAARGGLSGKKYPWGDTITPADANYDENVGDTTPVGQYPANGYGLHDMVGNVWEWCIDAYDADFYAASDNSRNPLAGGEVDTLKTIRADSGRVLRGGCWANSARDLRVADRSDSAPIYTRGDCGFRCVKDVAR